MAADAFSWRSGSFDWDILTTGEFDSVRENYFGIGSSVAQITGFFFTVAVWSLATKELGDWS